MGRIDWSKLRPRRREGALRAARIATRNGVPVFVAHCIAFAAALQRVKPSVAFAVAEQESNFRHIFGHDVGGAFPGRKVTHDRFEALIRRHAWNGVGIFQITYYGYILAHPKVWRILANCKVGLKIVKQQIDGAGGLRAGLARYNGGPTPPPISWEYADQVTSRQRKWAARFRR